MKKAVITYPRSGSHLLAILEFAQPIKGYCDDSTAAPKPVEDVIEQIEQNEISWFHYPYNEQLLEWLNREGIELVLLTRDPRDIMVSIAHFVDLWPDNFLNWLYTDSRLVDHPFEERIDLLIGGMKSSLVSHDKWCQTGMFHHCHFRDVIDHPIAERYNAWKRRGITGSHKDEMTDAQIERASAKYKELIEVW